MKNAAITFVLVVFGCGIIIGLFNPSCSGQAVTPEAPTNVPANPVTPPTPAPAPSPIVVPSPVPTNAPAPPAVPNAVVWTGNYFYLTNEKPVVEAQIVDNRIITNRVHTNIVAMPFEIGIHSSGVLVWRQK